MILLVLFYLQIDMDEENIFNTILIKDSMKLYEGCGNKVLIIRAKNNYSYNDISLRKLLRKLGLKCRADSVMVLKGNPDNLLSQGYHVSMDVFDPRGNDSINPSLPGSWATMCGNGIRAVTRYLYDTSEINCYIATHSGTRKVTILPNHLYKVDMGNFTTDKRDLGRYVHNYNFVELIPKHYKIIIKEIFVGLNGNQEKGIINGEPHLVLFIEDPKGKVNNIEYLANEIGPSITNNRSYFPECINTNLVILKEKNHTKVDVSACTYERGVDYVTQACGTGATVIGSYFLKRYKNLQHVKIHMPGGTLLIEKGPNQNFFMTGPANPIY